VKRPGTHLIKQGKKGNNCSVSGGVLYVPTQAVFHLVMESSKDLEGLE